jgi:hypothetical protein
MKLAFVALLGSLVLTAAASGRAQTDSIAQTGAPAMSGAAAKDSLKESYAVIGATPEQEAALREQIGWMRPEVLPTRVIFVPHWKYLDNARIFQLHVPAGWASVMFTHLSSRTVFVDSDRYLGKEWLGHWMAHELGHLALNSPKEDDAERVAKKLRPALKAQTKKA